MANNTAGTANITGSTSVSYLVGDVTVATLGISAVGDLEDSTSINVTITNLIDSEWHEIIPRTPVNAPVEIANVVDLVLLPAAQSVAVNQTFVITVQCQPNGQDTSGIQAYIDFDPDYLAVQAVTPNLAVMPSVILNSFDNNAGTIDYAAGTIAKPTPSHTFTVFTVTFLSRDGGCPSITHIDFHFVPPPQRNTDTGFEGASNLRSVMGASVTIELPLVATAVTTADLVSIEVTPANPSIALGLTQQFTVIGIYDDESIANITDVVTWASTNEVMAIIQTTGEANPGLATSLAAGTTTITATLYAIKGTTTLTVTGAEELVALPVFVEPGVTDVPDAIDENGVFTEKVTAKSEDGRVELAINAGTTGKTKEGEPLSEISITEMEEPPAPPADSSVIGLTYNLGPDGATFDPPITLTFTYDPAEIPKGVNEADLVIAIWDGDAGKWVVLEGSTVDLDTHTITTSVSHFTAFTIIARIAPLPEEDEVGLHELPPPRPPEEEEVAPQALPEKPAPINWELIGGIIAGCVVVGLLVYFFVWRRRGTLRPS